MQLSIIIPTYNEAEGITKLLTHIQEIKSNNISSEIIIVDGGSVDRTYSILLDLCQHLDRLSVIKSPKVKAKQLNVGAKKARGEILYFLHADTFPPKGFDEAILNAVSGKTQAGSFRMKFNKNTFFFNFWSWFTRFKWNVASGGDQSLFITKKLFNQIKGFDEQWKIMEDVEIISRIKEATAYIKLKKKVRTSTRKYDKVGALKLQFHFIVMQNMKIAGVSPKALQNYYNKKIKSV